MCFSVPDIHAARHRFEGLGVHWEEVGLSHRYVRGAYAAPCLLCTTLMVTLSRSCRRPLICIYPCRMHVALSSLMVWNRPTWTFDGMAIEIHAKRRGSLSL